MNQTSIAQSAVRTPLKALLIGEPNLAALRSGRLPSALIEFDFPRVQHGYEMMLREQAFDCSDLAIGVYLQAKALGKPLVMLPFVISGQFHHGSLFYNPERGALSPRDLPGRRVGVKSYAQTTGMWVRGILQRDYGVDIEKVTWVTYEDGHVDGYREPSFCERAPAGKQPEQMLIEGELDAAILIPHQMRGHHPLQPLIPDPEGAALEWYRRCGAIPMNHVPVVTGRLSRERPELVREFHRLLLESKEAANLPLWNGLDLTPVGFESNRRSLEVAIEYSFSQGLIARRLAVDELFDATTRGL